MRQRNSGDFVFTENVKTQGNNKLYSSTIYTTRTRLRCSLYIKEERKLCRMCISLFCYCLWINGNPLFFLCCCLERSIPSFEYIITILYSIQHRDEYTVWTYNNNNTVAVMIIIHTRIHLFFSLWWAKNQTLSYSSFVVYLDNPAANNLDKDFNIYYVYIFR